MKKNISETQNTRLQQAANQLKAMAKADEVKQPNEYIKVSEYTQRLIQQVKMMDQAYDSMAELLRAEHGEEQGEMMLNECFGESWDNVMCNIYTMIKDSVISNLMESNYEEI